MKVSSIWLNSKVRWLFMRELLLFLRLSVLQMEGRKRIVKIIDSLFIIVIGQIKVHRRIF